MQAGGDLIWQIGTGYFGCRNKDGNFDAGLFQTTACKTMLETGITPDFIIMDGGEGSTGTCSEIP